MALNGSKVLVSALTTAGSILAFGFASPKVAVQITSMICAAIVIVGAFAHDAVKNTNREKTVQRVAESVTSSQSGQQV